MNGFDKFVHYTLQCRCLTTVWRCGSVSVPHPLWIKNKIARVGKLYPLRLAVTSPACVQTAAISKIIRSFNKEAAKNKQANQQIWTAIYASPAGGRQMDLIYNVDWGVSCQLMTTEALECEEKNIERETAERERKKSAKENYCSAMKWGNGGSRIDNSFFRRWMPFGLTPFITAWCKLLSASFVCDIDGCVDSGLMFQRKFVAG